MIISRISKTLKSDGDTKSKRKYSISTHSCAAPPNKKCTLRPRAKEVNPPEFYPTAPILIPATATKTHINTVLPQTPTIFASLTHHTSHIQLRKRERDRSSNQTQKYFCQQQSQPFAPINDPTLKFLSLSLSHSLKPTPLLLPCQLLLQVVFHFLSKTLTPPMPTLRLISRVVSSQIFSQFLFSFFFAENRTRWRKRKRDSQISRRHQKHEEEEDDDEENPNAAEEDHAERDYDSEDQTHHNHPNSQPHVEAEVLSDHGVQISQFPAVIKRSVNRPHSSVTAIVALERALESGDNKAQSALDAPILENVSHGQLQALSSVPSDNFALDCDSSFVITPPPILEGRGVVKRFGTKVLVVPMHSGQLSFGLVFVWLHFCG